MQLPSDILDDLRDAFNFYDKNGYVGLVHFKNILHNFGFHNIQKKEMDDELHQQIYLNKDKQFDFDTIKAIVTTRLMKNGGRDAEAKECFEFIDAKDKKWITLNDLKATLTPGTLGFNVSESDLDEFMEVAGAKDRKLMLPELTSLYNS